MSELLYVALTEGAEVDELLTKPGYWLVANIRQDFGWVERNTCIKYRGFDFLLLPETADLLPSVALNYGGKCDDKEARDHLLGFLSALSWTNSSSLRVVHMTGGSAPIRGGKARMNQMTHAHFDIKFLPIPDAPVHRLALSLYRDAMSLDHVAYRFLALYRIVQLVFNKDGKAIKNWVTNTCDVINGHEARKRVQELRGLNIDVNNHLYQTNRGAIAHASENDLTVDPDNREDDRRLREDTPLLVELVERAMEQKYGFVRTNTIFETHLNELFGFQSVLGNELCEQLKRGQSFGRRFIQAKLPSLSLRVRGKPRYTKLEGLVPRVQGAYKGVVELRLCNQARTTQLFVTLDFPGSHLGFDPLGQHLLLDDGSSESALCAASMYRFLADVMMNGCIELWSSESNKCLGWLFEYIPVNIMPHESARGLVHQAEQFERLAAERASKEGAPKKN